MTTLTINLGGNLGWGRFEEILAASYHSSLRARHVVFSIEGLDWIGVFPTTLLAAWVAVLRSDGNRRVEIDVPVDSTRLSAQVYRALVECRVVDYLASTGAEVTLRAAQEPRNAIPLSAQSSNESLWQSVTTSTAAMLNAVQLSSRERDSISDVLPSLLYELGENAIIHGGGQAICQALLSKAGRSTATQQGLVARFPEGTAYVELTVGDVGVGIQKTLQKSMPTEYTAAFASPKALTKAERVLSYAFEFSSTSNIVEREKRLATWLARDDFDAQAVATGLFCVLEFIRRHHGQLIVRTPTALLSFDATEPNLAPTLRGRRVLMKSALAPLEGTHYWLRLPFLIRPLKRPARVRVAHAPLNVQVLGTFLSKGSGHAGKELQNAITVLDRHLHRVRHTAGVTVLRRAPTQFPPRAIALFTHVLQRIPHGEQIICWMDRRSAAMLRPTAPGKSGVYEYSGTWPIFVGDLTTNAFVSSAFEADSLFPLVHIDGEIARFDENTFDAMRAAFDKHVQRKLQEALRDPRVRHAPGPFLVEGKYYTEVFFEIARALENPDVVGIAAEWCLHQLTQANALPELLIATTPGLERVLRELAALMARAGLVEPVILVPEDVPTRAWVLTQLVLHAGKKAAIVTDVICRGRSVEEFLLGASTVQVLSILAFVDAREPKERRPISMHSRHQESARVLAILEDPIVRSEHAPETRFSYDDELGFEAIEKIYVIDRRTHSPTLHVRPYTARVSLTELVDLIIPESRSLVAGHIECDDKHYSHYINFRQLFVHQRRQIEQWITDQLDFVTQEDAAEAWHARVYDPDGSLSWLRGFLPRLPQAPTVAYVQRDQLSPMIRDSAPAGHWVFVLAGSSSGDTIRECIEYVSRHRPKSILVLCVVSRMQPLHLSFLLQVRQYRDAALRVAVFLEFPLGAADAGPSTCKQCHERAEFERLQAKVRRGLGPGSRLEEVLIEKAVAAQKVIIERDDDGHVLNAVATPTDIRRAGLFAMYEGAEKNPALARLLHNRLFAIESNADDLLGGLRLSHLLDSSFSPSEFRRRLYKEDAFHALQNRLHTVLLEAVPPFPIGKYVAALLLLDPVGFCDSAAHLLERFARSTRDVEEICVGLLFVDTPPRDTGTVLETLRGCGRSEAAELLEQTSRVLVAGREPDDLADDNAVYAMTRLWAALQRSSELKDAVDSIVDLDSSDPTSWQALQGGAKRAREAWLREVSPLLTQLQGTRLWSAVVSDSADYQGRLDRLGASLSRLMRLYKIEPAATMIQALIDEGRTYARDAAWQMQHIAEHLDDFFVNPLQCAASNLPQGLPAVDGEYIHISVHLDKSVDLVFCDLGELDAVWREFAVNWQKYGAGAAGPRQAWYRLYKDGKFIVLEFGDSFGGGFDMESHGGIAMARRFVERYGGRLETKDLKDDKKAIRIYLRRTRFGLRSSNISEDRLRGRAP